MDQITPQALKQILDGSGKIDDQRPLLLDVREPWEHAICRIPGSELLPMRQVPANVGQLDQERPVVVICHHGIRSQQVARFLEHQGLKRVINLRGGVAAWASDIDPKMPTY
ncbi:rhodanese-like domain-containing protein [Lamprobacter modestohalophilus]|uniref:rhodanese-like domain-containing protein n=1 Tax=Lamprobacter modestohalophilus TaxID=1064514 RepID=UPI002ADEEC69|nr:rhodanese-like domain-containing protein [Lamprobacter modestohalophilus]MEA1048866.1 rhodanese-like domain-containing protein [Lamprobacter modestohalophilus]